MGVACAGCAATGERGRESGCSEAVAKGGNYHYSAGRWEYFSEPVVSVSPQADGGALLAFGASARAFLLPGDADPSFLRHAEQSLEAKSPLHVAIEPIGEPGTKDSPGEGHWEVRWLHPAEQHPSCQ